MKTSIRSIVTLSCKGIWFLACCALFLFCSSLPAQVPIAETTGQSAYQLSVITRIVVLDVVVVDKKGNLVPRNDLVRDDFKILEGGTPQKILSFESPDAHQMSDAEKPIVNSAADLSKIGDSPVTILVLDELNSQFQDMSFARQMMIKYLQSQPAILKQPTALMIAQNTKFLQVHDYTQNRDELIEIVRKHMPEYPWRMMRSGGGGSGAVERMAQTLGALQQLAQASRGTHGRKNVIWVGNGTPSVDIGGIDQEQAAVITAAVRAVTAKLLASRITVYSINPMAGSSATIDVETPDDLDAASAADMGPFGSGTINFSDFAVSTGGLAFQGRNDLNNVIADGIARGNHYYTMSYSPADKTDDPTKFRNITIVMKDPNLRAVTRRGYFQETAADVNPLADTTISPKQKQRDLELDLSQALRTNMVYNGLNVTVQQTNPSTYMIHVADTNLGWSPPASDGSEHAEATVAAAWYDSSSKMLGHLFREETSPRGSASGATFTLSLPDTSHVARLRFVVRDAFRGTMGTADLYK